MRSGTFRTPRRKPPCLVTARAELVSTLPTFDGVTETSAGSTEHLPRLLVVEDEAPVRRMLRDVFQSFGYDVVVAASGAEALKLFADGGYDAVVTDLLMPGMNGWEVVARLRHAVPDVPVIMLTGSVPDIDFERVRRERITLVQKPATLSRLRAVLREVLAGRDAGR